MSDTHGDVAAAAAGVRTLVGHGVDLLLHLGDVGSAEVLEELVGLPARVVFGNCDDERELSRDAERYGIVVDHPAGSLTIEGRRLVYTHGHDAHVISDALRIGVDYIAHGHTHRMRDERHGPTRIINPGALHRASRLTVAVLDVGSDHLQWLDVPKPR